MGSFHNRQSNHLYAFLLSKMADSQSVHSCRSSNIVPFPVLLHIPWVFQPMNFSSLRVYVFHSGPILVANNYILVPISINVVVEHANGSFLDGKSCFLPSRVLVKVDCALFGQTISNQVNFLIKRFKRLNPIRFFTVFLYNDSFERGLQQLGHPDTMY